MRVDRFGNVTHRGVDWHTPKVCEHVEPEDTAQQADGKAEREKSRPVDTSFEGNGRDIGEGQIGLPSGTRP
jgi:hypothetical protein